MKNLSLLFCLLLFACSDSVNEDREHTTPSIEVQNPKEVEWTRKKFMLADSIDFNISVYKGEKNYSLNFNDFAKNSTFQDFLQYTKTVLADISKEIDFNSSIYVKLTLDNEEWMKEVGTIPEIKANIEDNRKKGYRWVDFVVVSDNIGKSELLRNFIQLFEVYDLKTVEFIAEKCHYKPIGNNEYSVFCAMLRIKMQHQNELFTD